jgi:hypothetical protein
MIIRHYVQGGGTFAGVTDDAFPRLVPFGAIAVPESFTAVLEPQAGDLPGTVTVRVRVDVKRGPLIEEVTLTAPQGRSVSAEDLHRLPLAAVRDAVMTGLETFRLLVNEHGEVVGAAARPPGVGAAAIRAELRRHSWQRLDDAHLREVAEVYRAVGRHPTKAVAERFGVPRPTAARWVATARERGLLEPAGHLPTDTTQHEGDRA